MKSLEQKDLVSISHFAAGQGSTTKLEVPNPIIYCAPENVEGQKWKKSIENFYLGTDMKETHLILTYDLNESIYIHWWQLSKEQRGFGFLLNPVLRSSRVDVTFWFSNEKN